MRTLLLVALLLAPLAAGAQSVRGDQGEYLATKPLTRACSDGASFCFPILAGDQVATLLPRDALFSALPITMQFVDASGHPIGPATTGCSPTRATIPSGAATLHATLALTGCQRAPTQGTLYASFTGP